MSDDIEISWSGTLNIEPGMAALRLNSGVPVVTIEGEWSEAIDSILTRAIRRLAHSGHSDIILNLTKLQFLAAEDKSSSEFLSRLASIVKSHFGRLDVVGTVEQVERFVKKHTHMPFMWATSEEQALTHLKGIPVRCSASSLTMRISHSTQIES